MSRKSKDITVKHIAYHRNGISGVGFYVALMDCPDAGEVVVVRFPGSECRTAVLSVPILASDKTPEDRIGFARGNSWRGDRYDPPMLAAIRGYYRHLAEKYPNTDTGPAEWEEEADRNLAEFLSDEVEV